MTDTTTRSLARRLGPVVLLAVVLAGCGDRGVRGADAAGPASAPTSTRNPATNPTTSPNASGIPDDFPLAEGLVADGDITVTTPRRDVKGIGLDPTCWGRVWPGAAVDRLVVEQVGPELGLTRELAVYPDAATATAVVEQVRADAARCHRLPATSESAAMDVTPLGHDDTGDVGATTSFAETMAGGQPGGSLFILTRVGRAVLAVEHGGEWTRGTADLGARDLQRADRDLVDRLCLFSGPGC